MTIFSDEKIKENFRKLMSAAEDSGWSWWKKNEYIEGRDFFDGIEHYDPQVLKQLSARNMRPVVFNRTSPFIKGVANNIGKAIGVSRFYPLDDVSNTDEQGNVAENPQNDDYATSVNELSKWGRNQGNFEREDNLMRIDAAICGVGVMESRLDMEGDNPFGEPSYTRVPPIEIIPDQDAQAANFSDARDIIRAKIMSKEDFEEKFSDSPAFKGLAGGVDTFFTMLQTRDDDSSTINPMFEIDGFDSRMKEENITVFDYQWWQKVPNHIVENFLISEEYQLFAQSNPVGDALLSRFIDDNGFKVDDTSWVLDDKQLKQLKEMLAGLKIKSAEKKKKKYFRAFIAGNMVLESMDGPFSAGFTYSFFTMYYDERKRVPYGFMRMLKDGQRSANAAFLHLFHSVLSAPKPSVFVEEGVTDNHAAFEEKVANRDSVVWLKDGKLQSLRENIPVTTPTGFENPLAISVKSQFETTGLNFEILGQQTDEISGVLDKQRTERGYDMLLDVINNYRMFIKEIGRKDLDLFKDIAEQAPGQIIKVVGNNGVTSIPMLKDSMSQNFAVLIDDAPASINQKSENIKVLMELMQAQVVPPDIVPQVMAAIYENADMPKDLRDSLTQAIKATEAPNERELKLQEQNQALQQQSQELQNQLVQANTVEKENEAKKDLADVELKLSQTRKTHAQADEQELKNQLAPFNLTTTNQ